MSYKKCDFYSKNDDMCSAFDDKCYFYPDCIYRKYEEVKQENLRLRLNKAGDYLGHSKKYWQELIKILDNNLDNINNIYKYRDEAQKWHRAYNRLKKKLDT